MANNVINAVFSSSTITYTKPAYQYDYGMILQFSGIELPQAYEVHFSNTEFCGESISQIGDADGVTIPDEMFLSGAPIYAWTFLHTGEDDGETVYKTVISINKRAQPSDIEPTPVQQDVITQAIAALNTAVEQTAADVVASGENAQAAANSAEAAGQAKDDAVEAQGKAEDAQEAAETAQGKAEDAQRAAEQAAGSVLGLTADATVDANTGTPSVEVDVTTETDHKHMEFTFRNLKGVQGDPGDPGVGISSVVLNADYTLTINLTNGASYTTTSIRGEVGATPNLTIGTIATLPEGSQATATITGTDEEPVLNLGIPVGDTGDPGISPTITVTEITGGHEVEVVDAEGTQTFNVMDGLDGQSGLITDYIAEEKTPYLFRPSANGLANVISEKDMIVGGTVAWNQLVQNGNFADGSVWTKSAQWAIDNGKATFDATSESPMFYNLYQTLDTVVGHKYLCACTISGFDGNAIMVRLSASENFGNYPPQIKSISSNGRYSGLYIATASLTYFGIKIQIISSQSQKLSATDFVMIDLTQMFGSTIADYLYTLEQGSSGSGIAKLKEWGFLQKDYYPYNSGDLMSVQTSAHRMVWKNQFDQDNAGWVTGKYINASGVVSNNGQYKYTDEYTKVNASTQYAISCTKLSSDNVLLTVCFYDSEKTFIERVQAIDFGSRTGRESGTFTTTSRTAFIRFSTVYNSQNGGSTDFQLEFGSTATEFEPYTVHSYPLDSDLVLRGITRLDAQNNLYYYGDTYESNGTVTRRFGVVDLGTLDWYYRSSAQTFAVNLPSMLLQGGLICTGYPQSTASRVEDMTDKTIWNAMYAYSANNLVIKDSAYSDATTLKASLSGVYLVYELATPTTETADPYSEYQIVDADGTEEYVDERTVPIPVGHDTFYQQAVDVPQLPTADGQYQLNLTKVGNTATASWGIISQTNMVASANIQHGKYFSVGEKLYLASQSISQGETIVVGNNCTEVSLADALNTINS